MRSASGPIVGVTQQLRQRLKVSHSRARTPSGPSAHGRIGSGSWGGASWSSRSGRPSGQCRPDRHRHHTVKAMLQKMRGGHGVTNAPRVAKSAAFRYRCICNLEPASRRCLGRNTLRAVMILGPKKYQSLRQIARGRVPRPAPRPPSHRGSPTLLIHRRRSSAKSSERRVTRDGGSARSPSECV